MKSTVRGKGKRKKGNSWRSSANWGWGGYFREDTVASRRFGHKKKKREEPGMRVVSNEYVPCRITSSPPNLPSATRTIEKIGESDGEGGKFQVCDVFKWLLQGKARQGIMQFDSAMLTDMEAATMDTIQKLLRSLKTSWTPPP